MECKSRIESFDLSDSLQSESYKTGIQAGPTNHSFLFYFSLHFHENALLLSSLIARRWVGLQTL